MQFVQQLRMNQAVYLLRDENRRIGEIADALGYADMYTFSKMFKRSMGLSPKSFREKGLRMTDKTAASGPRKEPFGRKLPQTDISEHLSI